MCLSLYDYVPDSVLVNYAAMDITVGQKTSAYSKVVLVNADGDEFSSGTDEGMTLRVDLPWATQSDADNLLAKFTGRRYQSYTARDSFVSPDADLGEMVRVAGVKSSILNKRTEFGRQISSTISAPGEEELDHEYEYVTRVDREAQRQRSYFGGAIGRMQKKLNESIDEVNDDILENYNELVAALNGDDGAPEDLKAGIANYVRWDLKNGEGFAGTKLFSEIGNKAKSEIDVYTYVDTDGNKHSLVDVIARVDDSESGLATKVGTADLTATLKNYSTSLSGVVCTRDANGKYSPAGDPTYRTWYAGYSKSTLSVSGVDTGSGSAILTFTPKAPSGGGGTIKVKSYTPEKTTTQKYGYYCVGCCCGDCGECNRWNGTGIFCSNWEDGTEPLMG